MARTRRPQAPTAAKSVRAEAERVNRTAEATREDGGEGREGLTTEESLQLALARMEALEELRRTLRVIANTVIADGDDPMNRSGKQSR